MPEDMSDRMPDRMPEDMSDRIPEDLPVTKRIHVMVGITRSKVCFLNFTFAIFEDGSRHLSAVTWGSILDLYRSTNI